MNGCSFKHKNDETAFVNQKYMNTNTRNPGFARTLELRSNVRVRGIPSVAVSKAVVEDLSSQGINNKGYLQSGYSHNSFVDVSNELDRYITEGDTATAHKTETDIRLYKGKHFQKRIPIPNHFKYIPPLTKIYDSKRYQKCSKVVVFDLDETIGNFADLYLIWTAIFNTGIYTGPSISTDVSQQIFNELLDLYPEFLRYGILDILEFIRTKIQNGESHRIYLYTNNQCEFSACDMPTTSHYNTTEWIEMIIVYLNKKIKTMDTIFAKPICAFKIGNRVIEPLRETTSKTHRDFLKCAILPKHTEICFIDDAYHVKMKHDKVYYIQPPPYIHGLSRETIIDRFMNSPLFYKLRHSQQYTSRLTSFEQSYQMVPRTHTRLEGEISNSAYVIPSKNAENNSFQICSFENKDVEIYHKLLYYIKEFFCIATKNGTTRRVKKRLSKFTRKKYSIHNRK
jgi:hypothetical protein